MIVKCDQCQTRFKIPDEKVTDKGVKVRCTRCQHTFRVRRDGVGAAPAPSAPSVPPAVPPSTASLSPSIDPFAELGLPQSPPAEAGADPFADPGLGDAPAAGPDPLAGLTPPPVAPTVGRPGREGLRETRPPVRPSAPRPSAPALAPSFEAQADLPAEAFDSPTKVAAVPPHLRDGRAPAPRSGPVPPPVSAFDDGPDLELEPPPRPAPPRPAIAPAPGLVADVPGPSGDDFFARPTSTAPQRSDGERQARPPEPNGFGAEFDFSAAAAEASGAEVGASLSGPGMKPEDRADLFDMPPPAPAAPAQLDAPRKVAVGRITAPSLPEPISMDGPLAKPAGQPHELSLKDAPPRGPAGRAVALALNLMVGGALAAFLVATAAIYLHEGKVELSSYSVERLKSILASRRELVARDVSNGLYDTRGGRPIFYVRGEVENRSEGPRKARVKVEILDGDQLVRSAVGDAGKAPTPEDLFGVDGAAELEALGRRLSDAASDIGPGARAPFLIAFYEYPSDLSSIRLRVTVDTAPAGRTVAR